MPQKVRYRLVRIQPNGKRGTVLERAKREAVEGWKSMCERNTCGFYGPKDRFEIEEFVKEEKGSKG